MLKNPLWWHRVAQKMNRIGLPALASLVDYFVRWFYGCWCPHTVQIGKGSSLGYGGLGCVIHGDSVIGRNVHIGANVLLGGDGRRQGVPVIEDDVFIGFGAVLMGSITVGKGSVVGANTVVTKDIPPGSVVVGSSARVIGRDISSGYLNLAPARLGKGA
jgi:serine O-acetyltransferase